MTARRSWHVLREDLRVGPRSPVLLWALIVPVVMTLLLRGVLGGLFAGEPRLGIADEGDSALVAAARSVDGVEVLLEPDARTLRAEIEAGRLDAGVALPPGFDDRVRAGERPALELFVSGESRPADRAVLTVTVLDLVRDLGGQVAPVEVEIVQLGEDVLPLELRLLPLLVLYAVAIPGGMVPASSLVEEKVHGTLQALLATPTSMAEVLVAKGALGVLLGTAAGVVTLTLNDAYGAQPLAVVLAILLGAVMMAEVGLLIGSWAPDTNTLFAAWKGGGLILFLPAIFFIWPDLPTWPARLMPAFYFLRPAYAVSVEGATLGDVAGDLAIGAAICLALAVAVVAIGRWLELRLAAGRVRSERGLEPADA